MGMTYQFELTRNHLHGFRTVDWAKLVGRRQSAEKLQRTFQRDSLLKGAQHVLRFEHGAKECTCSLSETGNGHDQMYSMKQI